MLFFLYKHNVLLTSNKGNMTGQSSSSLRAKSGTGQQLTVKRRLRGEASSIQ